MASIPIYNGRLIQPCVPAGDIKLKRRERHTGDISDVKHEKDGKGC